MPKVIFVYYDSSDEDEAPSGHEQDIFEKAKEMSIEHSAIVVADVAYTNQLVER